MSIQIIAIQAFGAEKSDQVRPIGRHSAVCVRRFWVPLKSRHTLMRGLLPHYLSGVLVQTEYLPLLRFVVFRRTGISVEADFERRRLAFIERNSDKQAITPNDRTRVAQARNGCFPQNIFRVLNVPG